MKYKPKRLKAKNKTRLCRGTALALAAVMLFALLPLSVPVAASPPGAINIVSNPGFESGADDWGVGGGVMLVSSEKSARVAAGTTGNRYAYNVVSDGNHDYTAAATAGMWVYLTDAADASNVSIYLERPYDGGNDNLEVKPNGSLLNQWQKVEIAVPEATNTITHFAIKFQVWSVPVGDIYFNDASIVFDGTSENLVQNPSFEEDWTHWGQEGVTIFAGRAHGDSHSAMVPAGATGDRYAYNVVSDGNHDYTAAATAGMWVYLTDAADASNVSIFLERPYDGGDENLELHPDGGLVNQWQKVEITVPEATNAITRFAIKFQVWDIPVGDIFFDDAYIQFSPPPAPPDTPDPWDLVGINLVNNWNFEAVEGGDPTKAQAWGGERAAISQEQAHSGVNSMLVSPGITETAYQFSGISAVYNYSAPVTAGIWVYLKDATDYDKVQLVLERKYAGGTENVVSGWTALEQKTGWQQLEISGDAMTSPGTEHVLKFEVQDSIVGKVYFDDAYIITDDEASINWLRNSGFEDGTNAWGGINTARTTAAAHSGTAAIAMDLTQALDAYQSNGWWGVSSPDYDGTEDMTFSVWAKSDSTGTGNFQLRVERQNVDNIQGTFTVEAGSDWTEYVLQVPKTADPIPNEAIFHIERLSGSGTIYLDDARFTLKWDPPAPPPDLTDFNWIANGGFETTELDGGETRAAQWVNTNELLRGGEGIGATTALAMTLSAGKDYWQASAWWPTTGGDPAYVYDGSTDMTFSVWAKSAGGGGTFSLGVEMKDKTGSEVTFYSDTKTMELNAANTEWQEYYIHIPAVTGGNTLSEMILHIKALSGTGDILLDNAAYMLERPGLTEPELGDLPEPPEPPDPIDWNDYASGEDKTAGAVATGQTGFNLVANPGLEWAANPTEGWGVHQGGVQTDPLFTHSGATGLQLNGGAGETAFAFQVVETNFDRNLPLTAGVWVFLKDTADASKIEFIAERKHKASDGSEAVRDFATAAPTAQLGWQLLTVNLGNLVVGDCNMLVLTVKAEGGSAEDVYLDDAFVLTHHENTINFLKNPGFEQKNGEGDAEAWAFAEAARLRPGEGRSGSAVVMPLGSNSDYWQANAWWGAASPTYQSYDGSTDMTFSVWAKSTGGAGSIRLRVEMKDTTGQQERIIGNASRGTTITAADDTWAEYFVHVPAIQSGTLSEVIFHISGSGSGDILIDDAAFTAHRSDLTVPPPPPPAPPSPPVVSPQTPVKSTDDTGSEGDKTPGAVESGMVGASALGNGGFANGLDGWSAQGAITPIFDSPNAARSGTAALRATGKGTLSHTLPNWQDATAELHFSCWIWLSAPEDADKVTLSLGRVNGLIAFAKPKPIAGWQQVRGTYSGEAMQAATVPSLYSALRLSLATGMVGGLEEPLVLKLTIDGDIDTAYIDDFFVSRVFAAGTEFVSNGAFYQLDPDGKSVSHWGLMPGWETVPNAIEQQEVMSGEYSVRIDQSDVERALLQSTNWINRETTPLYSADTSMQLTVWLKYENVDGDGAFLKAERKYDGGTQAMNLFGTRLLGTSDGWVKEELYVPFDTKTFDEVLVGVVVLPGGGTVWVDSISFSPAELRFEEVGLVEPDPTDFPPQSGANWLTNPGFEQDWQDWGVIGSAEVVQDGAPQGEKLIKADPDAHLWNVIVTRPDTTREFLLSFQVRLEHPEDAPNVRVFLDRKTADDRLIARFETAPAAVEGWQQATLYVGAESVPATYFVLGIDTTDAAIGQVWFDDFYLTYATNNPAQLEPMELPPTTEEPAQAPPEGEPDTPAYDGYLANGSFETGDHSAAERWGAIPDWGTRISLSETAYEGARSVRIDLSSDARADLFQSSEWGGALPYDPSLPMLLEGYVKLEGVTGEGVRLKIERKYQNAPIHEPYLTEYLTGTAGWHRIELYLPPVDHTVEELVIGIEGGFGGGSAYFDGLSLQATEVHNVEEKPILEEGTAEAVVYTTLLKNPGVEELNPDGTVTHWDVWPGTPEEGVRKSYTSTEVKHGGNRSLVVELVFGNAQAVYQYRVMDDNPFPFDEDYIFSAWIKMENVAVYDGSGVKIGVKRLGDDGEEYNVYRTVEMGSYDWTEFFIEAPRVEGVNIIQYDVIVDMGAGTGKIYFDDFSLEQAELEQPEEVPLSFEAYGEVPMDAPSSAEPTADISGAEDTSAAAPLPVGYILGGVAIMAAGGAISLALGKRRKKIV